jgi:NPH3 family
MQKVSTHLFALSPFINNFITFRIYLFQEHSRLSIEERTSLCNFLECHKLSHETCIHGVQNNQMLLRLIVQALFLQQLHTHQALKDCFDSFWYVPSDELAITGTLTSNSASSYDVFSPSTTSLSNKEYE